jgi:hypothetical protein
MTVRKRSEGFAARPRDAEAWIKTPEPAANGRGAGDVFTARLTIDVTPALRGRIKVAAFQRGVTVAQMLRGLLDQHSPQAGGGAP